MTAGPLCGAGKEPQPMPEPADVSWAKELHGLADGISCATKYSPLKLAASELKTENAALACTGWRGLAWTPAGLTLPQTPSGLTFPCLESMLPGPLGARGSSGCGLP